MGNVQQRPRPSRVRGRRRPGQPAPVLRTAGANRRNHPRRQAAARHRRIGADDENPSKTRDIRSHGDAAGVQFRPRGRARGERRRRRHRADSSCWSADRPSSTPIGRSQRVSLSTPDIADALVTAPRELLVHGKTPGTISLLVWGDNGRITNYEVIVRRDLTPLEGQIRQAVPERADRRRRQRQGRRARRASSPRSTSSTAPRRWPPATSTSPRTSSTCCGSRRARHQPGDAAACGSPK